MIVSHATPATLARVYLPRSKFKDKAEYAPLITGFYYHPPCNFSPRAHGPPRIQPSPRSWVTAVLHKYKCLHTYIHTYITISVSVACFCMLHTTTLCKVHVLLNLFLHLHSPCHLFFGHVDLTCRADGTCTVTGLVFPVLEQCTGMKGSMMGVVCRGRI